MSPISHSWLVGGWSRNRSRWEWAEELWPRSWRQKYFAKFLWNVHFFHCGFPLSLFLRFSGWWEAGEGGSWEWEVEPWPRSCQRKVGCQPPMRGHCCKVLLDRPPTRLEAQARSVPSSSSSSTRDLLPSPPSYEGSTRPSERPPPTSGGNHRQTKSGQAESNRYRSVGYNEFALSLSNTFLSIFSSSSGCELLIDC